MQNLYVISMAVTTNIDKTMQALVRPIWTIYCSTSSEIQVRLAHNQCKLDLEHTNRMQIANSVHRRRTATYCECTSADNGRV